MTKIGINSPCCCGNYEVLQKQWSRAREWERARAVQPPRSFALTSAGHPRRRRRRSHRRCPCVARIEGGKAGMLSELGEGDAGSLGGTREVHTRAGRGTEVLVLMQAGETGACKAARD